MKEVSGYLLLLVALSFMLSACTIEKRRHMSGYHIEWFGKGKTGEPAVVSLKDSAAGIAPAGVKPALESPLPAVATDQNEVKNHVEENLTDVSAARKPAGQRLNERMARQVKLKWVPVPWMAKKAGAAKKTLQDYNKVGVGFGMVALIFSILCFICIAMALVLSEGWAALGWFAISLVFGLATLLFTIIAQTIFWKNGEGIPAMMILPLIVSVFAIYVLVRLVLDRVMRA